MSDAARRDAIEESQGLDMISGKRPAVLSVDHIVPVDEIVQMEGWKELTPDQQHQVLNNKQNLIAMDRDLNSSKGARSWTNWAAGRRAYGDAAADRMVQREQTNRGMLRRQIKDLRAGR
jgi:hypothetical protein